MANPIDIAVSKAKGMERAMEARRDGLVGVFQTIAGQHGEVASLIDRIKDDVRKRDSLWPRVRAALLAHEQAEIKTVYAVLDHYAELAPIVASHTENAQRIAALVERLDATVIRDVDWLSLFEGLADTVTEHANEEENDIFPAAINAIGTDRARDLDDRYRAAFKEFRASFEKMTH
jgi:hemerythrin superfamily protein